MTPRTRRIRSARPVSLSPLYYKPMFPKCCKDILPTHQQSNMIYLFSCRCGRRRRYVGKTTQCLETRAKQHVPATLLRPTKEDENDNKGLRRKTKMERSLRRRQRPSPAPPPLASICLTMWNVWKVTTIPCSKLSAVLDASPFYTSWNRYISSLWNQICVNCGNLSALSPCLLANKTSLSYFCENCGTIHACT